MEDKQEKRRPGVSVVIPTLNAEKTLTGCLKSIVEQAYDGTIEVIVADGGSTDGTLGIARDYDCAVVGNPAKTGEAGKARGVASATCEIIALIDSDNILPSPDWLSRMTAPFEDADIAGTEPISYEYRRTDAPLTRYCALLGMNDPLCYFLGNYDRCSALSGRWTGLDVDSSDRGDYLEVRLRADALPTMGANGFLVRKSLLDLVGIGDYLFDIDVIAELIDLGHDRFAKVKTGIVHIYGRGLGTFARKQLRRVRDFRYYEARGMRSYPWGRQKKIGVVRFCAYTVTVLPLLLQALMGYLKKPDPAWALHPPACMITLAVYAWGFAEGAVRPREHARGGWSQ